MSIRLSNLNEVSEASLKVRPVWRRHPTGGARAIKKSPKELLAHIDKYHEGCYDGDGSPTLCDMAGATGFDSVTQMVNHARRKGGETMRGISRGVLAVAASYEEQAQEGNRNAQHLLAYMPQFDSEEPASQTPALPFQPKQEVNLNITGLSRVETQGAQLSEQEAYLQLIKHKTYEEISAEVLETEQDVDGDFRVLTLDSE